MLIFTLCLTSQAFAVRQTPPDIDYNAPHVPEEIIVEFIPECSQEEVNIICNNLDIAEIKASIPGKNIYLLRIPSNKSIEEVINELKQYPKIICAEPNYTAKSNNIPNDTYFSSAYGLQRINAGGAWDTITDASSIIVAVLDSGVDYEHPDLNNNIWVNDDPLDGIDNDANGYIDDIIGWNFINGNNNPTQIDPVSISHGTMCAGIVGAEGNNNGGITGVCWNVKIMPLTVADASGTANYFCFIDAVNYAINNGAKIINYSYGGPSYSLIERGIIQQANNAGVLLITSAGNNSLNTDLSHQYPACYNCQNIISVGATDENDNMASFSNYGINTVDIAAPGKDIYSTVYAYDIDNIDEPRNYDFGSGTSFAAPYVAGACALVWANNPSLTHIQIKNKILNGSDSLSGLNGRIAGARRLNVNRALTADSNSNSDSNNLIRGCIVTASSYYNDAYSPDKAYDGIYGAWDEHEWASKGEMTPRIDFKWNEARTINKVVLYDRCNPVDHIEDAWMYLMRNDSIVKAIHLGMFPFGGSAKEVIFDPVTIDEIYLDIVDGWGLNVGLSEIQIFYDPFINDPAENLVSSDSAFAVASTEYNGNYSADKAIDGIYGAWDEYEWASSGEMTPYLYLGWSDGTHRINKVVLYDRCNPVDHIEDAWLHLCVGTNIVKSIHIGMFPFGGSSKEVIFDPIYIDGILLDIVDGWGLNVGLSEIQAFYDPSLETTVNLAESAAVTASSYYNENFSPNKANDGIYGAWDEYEWASSGEMAPWINFKWSTAHTINKVVLYDRCNPVDHISDAWMYLKKDGSVVKAIHLGMFPFGGAAKEINFDPISVDEIYLDITDGWGLNVGLSEIQVFEE